MMIRRGIAILLALVVGMMVASTALAGDIKPMNQEWCKLNPAACSTGG